MFQNVILPDVPPDQMRGIFSLLQLIANSESKAAAEFFQKLSAEKDAAIEAAKQAAADRAATEALARELSNLAVREAALLEGQAALARERAAIDLKVAEFDARMKALVAAVAPLKASDAVAA